MTNNTKQSKFAGFIAGYRAGNQASFSIVYRQKKMEINNCISMIFNETDQSRLDLKFKNDLQTLSSVLLSIEDSYDSLYLLAEKISLLINSFKDNEIDIQNKIESYIRRMVALFIELSKSSEDLKIMDTAIEIGEKLK